MKKAETSAISENIASIRKRVKEACQRSGRDPSTVAILPVTKTVELEHIKEALDCGFTAISENRVKEAQQKYNLLRSENIDVDLHFVGHLQSNKVNKVIRFASMIHSIDRMEIVQKLNKRLKKVGKTIPILIQVNVSGEDSKYGLSPDETVGFVKEAAQYKQLWIKGLMTIGLFSDDWPRVRKGFKLLRELRDQVRNEEIDNVAMDTLSMGMTNDFEIAIEEGATMIRVGRGIFGERKQPDSYYWPGIENTKK